MIKKIIALIVFSVCIVLTMPYAQHVIQWLMAAHEWIAQLLTNVFSSGQAGNLAKDLIALLSIPVLVGLVPAIIYWLIRRHWFPYFMEVVWIVWLIQAGALIAMYNYKVG